ncbi:MAG: hypothetical protein JRJ39_07030, partial [Deltaproteobacteria bacterium]|nr:hypothetical protein [Deltaproteobacteria bacterium]
SKTGGIQEIVSEKRIYKKEDLVDMFVKIGKKIGLEEKVLNRTMVTEELKWVLPGKDSIPIYVRIYAIYHGKVKLGKFDVLHEYNKAVQFELKGPYKDAQASIEKVISAVPGHKGSLLLWNRIRVLQKQDAEPSLLEGKLVFSSGLPTTEQKAVWEKYHSGIAIVTSPDASAETVIVFDQIKEGLFFLPVPSGTYRLTVYVPGFETFEKPVKIKGKTKIDVLLQDK